MSGSWELRRALTSLSRQPRQVALGASIPWNHPAGTVSAPFAAGESGEIAVEVIDGRGNELLVVKPLGEAT